MSQESSPSGHQMNYTALCITNKTQGPETTYEKHCFREKQTMLKLKHLYWNKEVCKLLTLPQHEKVFKIM